jgi:N-dimethylarginine dimethylaminohydrolase
MAQTVLLGDPACFRIRAGANPHTRDRFGRRKKVDRDRAIAQWQDFISLLKGQGIQVHLLPAVEGQPGLVFPANAGFRWGNRFYLSNLNPARAGEREYYRRAVSGLGLEVLDFPSPCRFEGEADFIPVGDPSGDPGKAVYLFTYGRIETQRTAFRWGFPPYRRIYGFRSDFRALPALEEIVGNREVIPLELVNEAHYHGDTVLAPFGPHHQFLLTYLAGLSVESQSRLRARFGDRLILLNEEDGRRFAANSFQIETRYCGERLFLLIMPDGMSQGLYQRVRSTGVVPCPTDLSEFLEKGGGAVKCMLLDLGQS